MSVASAINILKNLTLEGGKPKVNQFFVNETTLDLLLIEIIDSTQEFADQKYSKDYSVLLEKNNVVPKNKETGSEAKPSSSQQAETDSEVISALVKTRLEAIGFRIGTRLSERYSVDISCFVDALSVIKFLCKELWCILFGKQIDNLKTNHKGVFILQDYNFKWITKLKDHREKASQYLDFTSGIICGILDSFGIKSKAHL
ncbi:hypothetical protein BB560_003485 [Smittium megazygosporum]|uniref:Trafficking protein particle complex subunit n=1 Tax=Smittium megazygosporum TaxID=133381 RepID=A0A2T9ZBU2_9FUNG|nr:hypothetical protein BB560_003485 [Smittium megazygosporum]